MPYKIKKIERSQNRICIVPSLWEDKDLWGKMITIADKTPEELEKYTKQMRDWINAQQHLPKNIDDLMLLRFVHSCYFDVEKAKIVADMFFRWRAASSDLLSNRDLLSSHMQKILKAIDIAQLEISGNRNLWIWQLNDPGLENYDYILDVKLFLATSDAWLLNNKQFSDGIIVLMDAKDISLKFLTKFNLSVGRRLSKYQQESMPIRLKQVHVVNTPPIIDKIYAIMKPLMNKEVAQSVYFHTPNSDTLYKYLGKEDLPENYGGTRPAIKTLKPDIISAITSQRELLNENLWVATHKKKADVAMEMGSFKTLVID